jgi:hypothetical protein
MSKEINLDGTETSIIKALGFGSGEMSGATLASLASELGSAELIDTVKGLISVGYVSCDRSFQDEEEFKVVNFHINSGYARELKEALNPGRPQPKSRRVRRE